MAVCRWHIYNIIHNLDQNAAHVNVNMCMCIFIQDRRVHRHHIRLTPRIFIRQRMHPSVWSLLLLNVDNFPAACAISISPFMVPCKIPYCTVLPTVPTGHECEHVKVLRVQTLQHSPSLQDEVNFGCQALYNHETHWRIPGPRQEPVDLESPQVTPKTRPGAVVRSRCSIPLLGCLVG